jgi:GNAT superfamily N-acetyltransferase
MSHPGFRLRDATRADLPAIVRMLADDLLGQKRHRVEDPLPQEYYAAFDAIAASPSNRLYVAEIDGEIVGTIQLTFIPGLDYLGGERMLIEAVRVARERRNAGLGKAMITEAIEIARRRGCQRVELTSNASRTDAHRFYERLGFAASHVGMKLMLK